MIEDEVTGAATGAAAHAQGALPTPGGPHRPSADALPEHEVRRALLDLLAEVGTVTSTEAAGRLGYSSGLCSFHLRQLARYGLIEAAPQPDGRARPWRLRREAPPSAPGSAAGSAADARADGATTGAAGFGDLARGLEDESYQRWLAQRDQAPREWRQDEAFSAVVYLTPEEMSEVGAQVRQTLARFRHREEEAATRPRNALPVALVARLFPLLPGAEGDEGGRGRD